jgi:catechol 2,3-dioxygenase-like lactoylglutathione lyase family enzyme
VAIHLDHTIVPAKNKRASARFFAEIFGLTVSPGRGYFAQVRVNERLTLDFSDEPDASTGHYAFHVGEAEFEAIFSRIKGRGIPYGSEPDEPTNGRINTRRGGRGFYFEDPYGHLLEVMTVPETGSAGER